MKNLPGRKSDVSDATWLAQLGAHGLVRGSFVPPEPIRHLRDLTRARTAITRERGREVQRLEKLLEDAGIKLSTVASDIMGVSGRLMLHALINGQDDPAVVADLAKRRLRSKIPALTEALTGRFTDHHAFLAGVHLDLIDRHTEAIEQITARIEVVIEPFRGFRELICTIPGIGLLAADVIVAETGADMTRFPTAGHLASWAGTTPGSNESAGRVKSTKTRPGSPYPQGALGAAAMACSQNQSTYLGARYRRIAARRGPMKANVAIQHSMLIAIWHMGHDGTLYNDPGADFFTRLHPERAKNRALHQLEAMATTSPSDAPDNKPAPAAKSESSRQQPRALRARRGAGRFEVGLASSWIWCAVARSGENQGVAAVRRRILCSACVPARQHGGGGLPREPWIVAFEHETQTPELIPALPAVDTSHPICGEGSDLRWT